MSLFFNNTFCLWRLHILEIHQQNKWSWAKIHCFLGRLAWSKSRFHYGVISIIYIFCKKYLLLQNVHHNNDPWPSHQPRYFLGLFVKRDEQNIYPQYLPKHHLQPCFCNISESFSFADLVTVICLALGVTLFILCPVNSHTFILL